jgi:hypothetical protein
VCNEEVLKTEEQFNLRQEKAREDVVVRRKVEEVKKKSRRLIKTNK